MMTRDSLNRVDEATGVNTDTGKVWGNSERY